MKRRIALPLVLLGALPLCAQAYGPRRGAPPPVPTSSGFVDAYYHSAGTDFGFGAFNDGPEEWEGDGFGVRAMIPLAPYFLLTGEYQAANYDELKIPGDGSFDIDVDEDQFRFGGGVQFPQPGGAQLGGYVEYVNLEWDFNDEGPNTELDGVGVHLRGEFPLTPLLGLYGQIGYLSLEGEAGAEVDGPEWLIGAELGFTPNLGMFVDYRGTALEDEFGDDFEFDSLRVGLRFVLG